MYCIELPMKSISGQSLTPKQIVEYNDIDENIIETLQKE